MQGSIKNTLYPGLRPGLPFRASTAANLVEQTSQRLWGSALENGNRIVLCRDPLTASLKVVIREGIEPRNLNKDNQDNEGVQVAQDPACVGVHRSSFGKPEGPSAHKGVLPFRFSLLLGSTVRGRVNGPH